MGKHSGERIADGALVMRANPAGSRNSAIGASGHQGEQSSPGPGGLRSAHSSARPVVDHAALTMHVLCQKILRTISPPVLRSALPFIRLVYLSMVRMSDWLVLLDEATQTRAAMATPWPAAGTPRLPAAGSISLPRSGAGRFSAD